MATNPHQYEMVSWRADHERCLVKVMLWQQARRAPITIEVVLSRREILAIEKDMRLAEDEVAQQKMF